jgi:hypothetical protein
VVAINKKSNASVTAGIRLADPTKIDTAKVYLLAGTKPDLVAAPDLAATDVNAFSYVMPARSVSVLVFGTGGTAQPIDAGQAADSAAGPLLDTAATVDSQATDLGAAEAL